MNYRKFLVLVVTIFVISVGVVSAQSSINYFVQQHVLLSGGASESTSYRVESVIGQSAAGVSSNQNYEVNVGFVHPRPRTAEHQVWLPLVRR